VLFGANDANAFAFMKSSSGAHAARRSVVNPLRAGLDRYWAQQRRERMFGTHMTDEFSAHTGGDPRS
jgi:hypothetical protein